MFPGKLFTPPTMPNIGGPKWQNEQMIFLAGPIKGAPDWHKDAVEIIGELDGEVHLASPKPLTVPEGAFTEDMYVAQIGWEHHWLNYCARYGVIMFWLANEEKQYCDRAYGQTSRFELGWKVMKAELLGARVVVGFDDAFTNARYLRPTISREMPSVILCDSLEETCGKEVEFLTTL